MTPAPQRQTVVVAAIGTALVGWPAAKPRWCHVPLTIGLGAGSAGWSGTFVLGEGGMTDGATGVEEHARERECDGKESSFHRTEVCKKLFSPYCSDMNMSSWGPGLL